MKNLIGPLGAGAGALLLATASLGSYGAGLVRDLLIANKFGASTQTDAFFASFLLPDFLFSFLVLGFVSGALLPVFLSSEKESKEKAENIFRGFLTLVLLVTSSIALISFFIAPWVIEILFSTTSSGTLRSQDELDFITRLTRILLLSPILFGISNTLGMILLARKHFFSMAISPLLYNLGIIGGIVFFGDTHGIEAGIWGAVAGALLHLSSRALDFPKTKVSFLPKIFFSPEMKQIFLLGMPKMIGLISFQLTIIVFSYLAGRTEEGGIAAWNFARNIQSLPVSLFGIAFATAALPFLSDAFANEEKAKFLKRLTKSIFQILLFTLPAAVGLAIVANVLISVLFTHGAFGEDAAFLTTSILMGIAIAIPFESLTHLFSRAFLARKKTLLPAIGRILFFVVASTIAFWGIEKGGLSILGAAFAGAATLEMIFLAVVFHIYISPLSFSVRDMSILGISTLLVGEGAILALTFMSDFSDTIRLVSALVLGALFFLACIFFFRIQEAQEILFPRKKAFLSRKK